MRTTRWTGLMVALLVSGCSAASEEVSSGESDMPAVITASATGSDAPAGQAEQGDVNGDGKSDVWNYFKEMPNPADAKKPLKVLVRKEADLNFDGRKDIVRLFDDEGTIISEEADLDFDGLTDQRNLYQGGLLNEKQLFRSGDGKVFIWKFYENGKMIRFHRDDTGDGRADYCELWYAGEKLSKRGWDKTGTGECDYWENAE